jgi:hypothetical protein
MGNHYIPRAYLRGFCVKGSDSQIEVYDKELQKHYRTNIINAAQENGFYDDETEQQLATLVEDPAKPAIDKLRQCLALNDDDRTRLAVYAAVLLKRVPRSRERARDRLPKTVDEVVGKVRSQLQTYLARGEGDAAVIESHLKKIEGLEARLVEEPPENILQQINSPWPTQAMVEAIFEMKWRVVVSDGPQYFITTDNPGFFFGAYGLKNPESEFVLPLSSNVALAGDRSVNDSRWCGRSIED